MIRVFTAFSGYDSQCLALRRLNIDFDLVGWSEIDKFAIIAHDILFPEYKDRNYGDISKIDWTQVPDFDLFTYSSPCQDFSQAGKCAGGDEGSGTRSSLLWECRRAIIEKKPKYLLLENVPALTNKRNKPNLNKWLNELESYGYTNHVKCLNAKDYGVHQNRNRLFVVSILGEQKFNFPKPIELKNKLIDILENNVPNSYYISMDKVEKLKIMK